ncbi:MAG: FAD-binding oxidoreductase [Microgenomates group bacterium]
MKYIGNWLIWLAIMTTTGLYVMSKSDIGVIRQMPWLSASQLISLLGTMLLAWSFILSSRAFFLEYMFGGMDKVMKTHHIVGGLSFIMLINHPLFLAVDALPNYQLAARYYWLSSTVSYNLGVGALYVMILALLLTFVVKLPYDMWLKTHDFLGLTLLLGALHIFMISSDVSRYMPLRIWIFVFLGLALFSFVYKVVLYGGLGPKYKYRVKEVKKMGDILEIYLAAVGDKMRFRAGQFAFVNFDIPELAEKHPFTISSGPDSEEIRFSIKALGDHTLKLRQLKTGTMASVWGPYGRFYKNYEKSGDVVMIGGGIGVTPFLSMLAKEKQTPLSRTVHMFYGAASVEDAVYDNEITVLSEQMLNLKYYRFFGGNKPRINVSILLEMLGKITDKRFYICGPLAMMESMVTQLRANGVHSNNIIFEDFAFK